MAYINGQEVLFSAQITPAEIPIKQEMGDSANAVMSQKATSRLFEQMLSTNNLFTGHTLVEGYYYKQSPVPASTLNYYENIKLSAGSYSIYPKARYVVNTSTGEVIDGYTIKSFTVENEGTFNITVYAEDIDLKLFRSELVNVEVEALDVYSLNDELEIKRSFNPLQSGLVESKNLFNGCTLVRNYRYQASWGQENLGEAYDGLSYFKHIVLEAGDYVVYPKAFCISNITDKTDVKSVSTFTVEHKSIVSITVYNTDEPKGWKLYKSEYSLDEVESFGEYSIKGNIKIPNNSEESSQPEDSSQQLRIDEIYKITVENALHVSPKKSMSGALIYADDISQAEHSVRVAVSGTDNPTALKVMVCGKNLINIPNEPVIKSKEYTLDCELPAGTYTISGMIESTNTDTDTGTPTVSIWKADGSTLNYAVPNGEKFVKTIYPSVKVTKISIRASKDLSTSSGYTFTPHDIQLERGVRETAFEEYKGKVYTPSADGSVDGVISLSPSMTVFTNATDMVTLNVEYALNTQDGLEKSIDERIAVFGNNLFGTRGKNLIIQSDVEQGGLAPDGSLSTAETWNPYSTSGFIRINGEQCVVSLVRKSSGEFISDRIVTALYDANYNFISGTMVDGSVSSRVINNESAIFLRVTVGTNYFSNGTTTLATGVQVEKGDTPTAWDGFAESYLIGKIDMETNSHGNILFGKKWAVCGDSFSERVSTTTPDSYISNGIYAGAKKSYGYIIGSRNGMKIQHLAGGGKTLAYPASATFHNSFTDVSGLAPYNYTDIDEDVDYITLYFGINDSHHASGSSGLDGEDVTGTIPLGTIDDTDNTSFCGAWNVCLEWLRTHRPFAHIGIIVSNACDSEEYRTATIAMANKWGVPYIDLNGDERTPAMIRSKNPLISDIAKTAIDKAQAISYGSNHHPNAKALEYESTFIENWLRSL